jgi:thiol-disulfide isomerase/thioredoxin
MSESEPTAMKADAGQRRLWLGVGASGLLMGLGFSAWKSQQDPADEAIDTLFKQRYPIAAGPQTQILTAPPTSSVLELSTLRKMTVVINFWATWCPPCIEEMPDLSLLAQQWRKDFGEKVVTLGLGIDSASNIQKFYKKLAVSYDLLAANQQGLELMRLLGNSAGGLPFSIVINPQGKITERILGRFDSKNLDLAVRKIAGKS